MVRRTANVAAASSRDRLIARSVRGARDLLLSCAIVACASAARSSSVPRRAGMPAGVRVARSSTEYPVAAATFAEALQVARATGPVTVGGRFPGATAWRVEWRFQYDRRSGACALRDVRVGVTVEVTVPRWEPTAPLDSAASAAWRGYRERLDAHEEGHVNIALDAAAEIASALRDLSGFDCTSLGVRASSAAEGLLVRARARDAEYDRVTRHGAVPTGGADRRL